MLVRGHVIVREQNKHSHACQALVADNHQQRLCPLLASLYHTNKSPFQVPSLSLSPVIRCSLFVGVLSVRNLATLAMSCVLDDCRWFNPISVSPAFHSTRVCVCVCFCVCVRIQ